MPNNGDAVDAVKKLYNMLLDQANRLEETDHSDLSIVASFFFLLDWMRESDLKISRDDFINIMKMVDKDDVFKDSFYRVAGIMINSISEQRSK